MSELAIFQQFGKGSQLHAVQGSQCVIYTRVSTPDQTENLSLETQRKSCVEYAKKHNYTIVESFGGTHESAANDERKEFTRMLDFVKKSRKRISHIIVYSLDRFSRNEHAIWLSAQLRKLNIEVISVTQPMDTTNPAGQMHQRLVMVFNQFENELRKQKCTAGMKEMLLRGDWPTKPPLGYDSIQKNGARTIVINATGKLLRHAFIWKHEEDLSHDAIRARLAQKGVVLCRQRITAVLRNPFYCGLLSHNMLDGAIVQGNHEPLISRELFLKVNGVMDTHTHGYSIQEENEHIPLKRFLLCEKCSKPLRGYIVKKKGIHYYKCCTIGCGTNRNAQVLNDRFAEALEAFKLDHDPELLHLIKQQTAATFNQYMQGYQDEAMILMQKQQELNKKIERLEERFIEEELTADLYNKYMAKYNEELNDIETAIAKASQVSNLQECVNLAVDFAVNIPKKWVLADYFTKQRIQNLLFPSGILYNKETDGCRTERVNSVFLYLAHCKQIVLKKQKDIVGFTMPLFDLNRSVAGAGLEPTTFGL